jgi:phosphatidylserine/phosphatidylglycerophosphate/cardiolipin synthase-like enzyme
MTKSGKPKPKPREPHSRRGTIAHLIPIAILSAIAGYALAITIAKASAPTRTVYDLPHDFRVTDATFLPSALPGPPMTAGNAIQILENGEGIFPSMLAAIASAQKTVDFEAYIFWSGEVGDRFRDAFVERATHGVEVRILRAAFERDQAKCRPYTFEMWKHRPLGKRFMEWVITPVRSEL